MDVVIVRENEEDVYGGIEYRQTRDMTQCLKLISEPGCDRVIRAAFEFAVRQGRKKVTCFSKDNIMKITDGLFRRTFDRIAADYPAIETDHYIVDIGAARLADTPEKFDVIVMPNLYGDILSDVAAQIAGSVGLAGSANIGQTGAMFEAIHGSAPDIAGRDIANPSGLLMGSVLMLVHLGETQLAETIQNAWLRTIEDGIHTADIVSREQTKQQVGTRAFAQAVVERLGQKPHSLKAAAFARAASTPTPARPDNAGIVKSLVGVDLYFDGFGRIQDGTKFVETVAPLIGDEWKISSLSNRGTRVWPEGIAETFCVDHWCLRLRDRAPTSATAGRIATLLGRLAQSGWDVVKTENLYTFDGKNGFSSDGRE
jgi:isocitrate dehydrogenase